MKIEYLDVASEEFEMKIEAYKSNLNSLFEESEELANEIQKQLSWLKT